MKNGRIRILDKVYFEYELYPTYKLLDEYFGCHIVEFKVEGIEHEEPKSTIKLLEISNDYSISQLPGVAYLWIEDKSSRLKYLIKDKLSCKAKIEETATIIKIIK